MENLPVDSFHFPPVEDQKVFIEGICTKLLTIYKNVYNNNIKIIDGSKTPIKFTRKQYSFVIAT